MIGHLRRVLHKADRVAEIQLLAAEGHTLLPLPSQLHQDNIILPYGHFISKLPHEYIQALVGRELYQRWAQNYCLCVIMPYGGHQERWEGGRGVDNEGAAGGRGRCSLLDDKILAPG